MIYRQDIIELLRRNFFVSLSSNPGDYIQWTVDLEKELRHILEKDDPNGEYPHSEDLLKEAFPNLGKRVKPEEIPHRRKDDLEVP